MSIESTMPMPRIPLKFDVEFRRSYGRTQDNGVLKNISLTGAFLEHASAEIKPTDKVQIVMKVGGRIRKLNASVIWSCDRGCGIKFSPTNGRDVQIIDDLMYFVENKRQNRRSLLDDIFKQTG